MTEEELPRLRATRGANRGVITKLISEADTILENATTELDIKTRNRLSRIETMLKEKSTQVSELDEKIVSVCKLEEIEKEIDEAETLKMRVMDAIANISLTTTPTKPTCTTIGGAAAQFFDYNLSIPTDLLATTPSTQAIQPTGSSPASPALPPPNQNYQMMGPPPTTNATTSKLPKLTLPKFRGEVTQFKPFWDTFESAVHSNPTLSEIAKFNYLVAQLEGAASRAIAGLPITEDNYKAAVDILTKRFGKPQQIIASHMDDLLKISVCSSERPSQLRYLYDKISVNVRGLQALGIQSKQYGSLLIPVIMAKLPPDIRIHVARNTSQDVWEIEPLLDILQREIEAREISERVKTVTHLEPKRPPPPHHDPVKSKVLQPTIPPGSSGAYLAGSQYQQFTLTCVYCSGKHFSASFGSVTDINARKVVLKRDRRCFTCLRKGHNAEQCDKSCRKCNSRKHHQSICLELNINSPRDKNKPPSSSSGDQTENDTENNGVTTATTNSKSANSKRRVLLQTATAIATNDEGSKAITIRLLFDNGSQRSYITDNLRSKLQLKSLQKERLNLNTFGETKYKKQNCDVVSLHIRKSSESNDAINISALTFPVICSPLPGKVSVNYPHLDGLELADESFDAEGSIDMLIGCDYYWDFVTGETRRGDEGPIAVNSKLGWLLSGPVNGTLDRSYVTHSNLIIKGHDALSARNEDDVLTNTLKDFWETEAMGIKDLTQPETDESFKIDVAWSGDRYEVKLPWKEDCLPLSSDNYLLCESRLRSLHHKLRKDPELLAEYDNIIQDQLSKGIIEKVPEEDSNNEKNAARNHYLPHHAVVRKDRETTKVRIVYDGSAKSGKQEKSLNDCLETGPNHIPHVFNMLANFRKNPVGITADIEKAFLMVGIQEDHRDFLRFLWFGNPTCDKPQIVQYKFTRLVFGLRPSPAILGATILHHLQLHKQSDPEIAELLEQSLYVDDLLTGESDEERGLAVYKRCKKVMSSGGFNLRKWRSNSQKLQMEIAKRESSPGSTNTQQDVMNVNKEDDESFAKSSVGCEPATSDNEKQWLKF